MKQHVNKFDLTRQVWPLTSGPSAVRRGVLLSSQRVQLVVPASQSGMGAEHWSSSVNSLSTSATTMILSTASGRCRYARQPRTPLRTAPRWPHMPKRSVRGHQPISRFSVSFQTVCSSECLRVLLCCLPGWVSSQTQGCRAARREMHADAHSSRFALVNAASRILLLSEREREREEDTLVPAQRDMLCWR